MTEDDEEEERNYMTKANKQSKGGQTRCVNQRFLHLKLSPGRSPKLVFGFCVGHLET